MRVLQEHIAHGHQALRFLHLELGEFRSPRHRHRHLELTWIERGSGLRLVGDSAEPFGDGDLVLLGPELPHAWLSEPTEATALLRATVMQFLPETVGAQAWPELAGLAPLLDAASRGLQVGGSTHSRATALLRGMRQRSALGRVAGLLDVLDALAQGLRSGCEDGPADLRPLSGAAPASPRRPQGQRTAQVLDWIHQHMEGELPVSEAARIARVSPAAFSRYFRREVGKPFTVYVNDLRCAEACALLRQSSLPVAAVAERCGFGAVSNFNRQFLLRTGLSPREYRTQRAGR